MGAVGASVHKNAFENVTTLNFLTKSNIKHPQFEILNGDLSK